MYLKKAWIATPDCIFILRNSILDSQYLLSRMAAGFLVRRYDPLLCPVYPRVIIKSNLSVVMVGNYNSVFISAALICGQINMSQASWMETPQRTGATTLPVQWYGWKYPSSLLLLHQFIVHLHGPIMFCSRLMISRLWSQPLSCTNMADWHSLRVYQNPSPPLGWW
jgi:hypothetical protein